MRIPTSPVQSRRPLNATAGVLRASVLALAVGASGLTGCANMSEREQATAKGAGIGAVAGAVLSSVTGGKAGTGAVVGGAVGAVAGNLWSKRMEDKRHAMEQATKGTGVAVERTAGNELKVNVPSDVSFDTGSAVITTKMRPVLDQFASGLDRSMQVRVIGHTDSTGSDAINDPLSRQRATSVRDYLSARGVAASNIATDGVGSRQPVADNGTDSGRAQNRRVEIFLADKAAPAS